MTRTAVATEESEPRKHVELITGRCVFIVCVKGPLSVDEHGFVEAARGVSGVVEAEWGFGSYGQVLEVTVKESDSIDRIRRSVNLALRKYLRRRGFTVSFDTKQTEADAPLCSACGTKMRPAGTAYVCEECGSTSGVAS